MMERILIIDDSPVQANHLRTILEDEFDITLVHTAEEGLEWAQAGAFDLLLLDVVMPEMDGFMLLKKLQEQLVTRHIPVILITSLADIRHEEQGLSLGAVDYITKPFHAPIVKARVHTHIKLYQYRQQIERQAMIDQLTGAANRRWYERCSPVKWQEAIRLQLPLSVCMFDIDQFKLYNDTYGHPAGDKVITSVAKTIGNYLRRGTDFFARYGGEEFVALLLENSAEKNYTHLKRIRRAVEELHIPHAGSDFQWVTISIGGVTLFPKVGDSYETYLKIADTMLYDAKRFGRNRVVWTSDKMEQWRER